MIGKGYWGVMAVPEELVRKFTSYGIQIIAKNSSEAVNTFNNLDSKKRLLPSTLPAEKYRGITVE